MAIPLTKNNISIGFFKLEEQNSISAIQNISYLIAPLARYVNLITIPVKKRCNIDAAFKKACDYTLDYIYVDSFNFLSSSFLLRDKLSIDIPFILHLRTIHNWLSEYLYLMPLIRPSDIVITPTKYAKNSFLNITDKFKITTIPHSLDTQFIHDSAIYNTYNNKKIISFVGRVTNEKNVHVLIKLISKFHKQSGNIHLNIIGPLSGSWITNYPKSLYVKRLQRQVKKLGLSNHVHFKGVQFGAAKYKMLSQSDLFINPTTAREENFPMVNIEALACGVPVIATDWAGNKEIIKDGYNGFLVNVDKTPGKKPKVDTKQMKDLIVRVLNDKKLLIRLKKNALKSAEEYNYRKVMPRLIRLLKKRKYQHREKSRWEEIKDKTPADFAHLFNKDFLFFLYSDNIFRTVTYDMMYKSIIHSSGLKKLHPRKTKISRGNNASKDIINKIRQNCLDYLLLRDK